MANQIPFDKCSSYLRSQGRRAKTSESRGFALPRAPVVTLSRQAGANGGEVAERLAKFLRRHDPHEPCPWTVFDKGLVHRVCQDHNLEKKIEAFMPEDRISQIEDLVGEMLGLHPAQWTLVEKTSETILQLAEIGYAIVVGRAANVVIGFVPNAFHVRLVGSEDRRCKRIQELRGLSAAKALAHLRSIDRGRRRYVKYHFDAHVDNNLLYHLVINTDRLTAQEAAETIGGAVLKTVEHE